MNLKITNGKRRKKATIVTIYDPMPNIGNRLQNYAAQMVLEGLGFEADTLSFQRPVFTGKKRWMALAQQITGYRLPGDKNYWQWFPKRVRSFEEFNKRHIKTQRLRSIQQIQAADYFVLGSDQVWNPNWYGDSPLKKDLFLLTFAKPEQKVCLSPSFGVEALPPQWEPWFKEKLSSFPHLAVREKAGKRLIKSLTGRDAFVTIDPTLMLNRADWDKIAEKPGNIQTDQDYILTYFLSPLSEQADYDLKRCAETLGAAVLPLNHIGRPDLYICGPSHFLYLLSRTKLLLTDSFHGCIFSFLYQKPFLLYKRSGAQDMSSRLDTLLQTFDLTRKYTGSGLENELLECDYHKGFQLLEAERGKLLGYLRSAMDIR